MKSKKSLKPKTHSDKIKKAALSMRAEGISSAKIAAKLKIPVGTVSNWDRASKLKSKDVKTKNVKTKVVKVTSVEIKSKQDIIDVLDAELDKLTSLKSQIIAFEQAVKAYQNLKS